MSASVASPGAIQRATVVAGARPNFVKIAPVIRALRDRGIAVRLVHTGQHYDEAMSESFFRDLGIPAPDVDLEVGSATHGAQTGRVLERFEADLIAHPVDVVIVVGDVNSTIAAALAAVKLGVRVAHVEAGLRSGDREMPEEVNRVLTDQLSTWLFTTERTAEQNLTREGIDATRVHFCGNVMIDSLEASRAAWESRRGDGEYAVLTLHRPSNVDDATRLRGIFAALRPLAETMRIVFPIHPRTRQRVEEFGLQEELAALGRLELATPLGYLEFLGLFSGARLILTDSGGAQEEAVVLGVPCVTLRNSTERPITLEHGANRLVGSDPDAIKRGIEEALAIVPGAIPRPELWDGRAAERIAAVLAKAGGKSS